MTVTVATLGFPCIGPRRELTAMVGVVPPSYRWAGDEVDLETYFAMARGAESDVAHGGCSHEHLHDGEGRARSGDDQIVRYELAAAHADRAYA